MCPGGDICNIIQINFPNFHLQAKCHYSKYPIPRLWCIFCYIPLSNNLSLEIMMHIDLHCSKIWIVRLYIEILPTCQPWFWEGFPRNTLQVWKVAIRAILMRQQKVSSARETSQTEFFRFAIKRNTFCFENLCNLHPKICVFVRIRCTPSPCTRCTP